MIDVVGTEPYLLMTEVSEGTDDSVFGQPSRSLSRTTAKFLVRHAILIGLLEEPVIQTPERILLQGAELVLEIGIGFHLIGIGIMRPNEQVVRNPANRLQQRHWIARVIKNSASQNQIKPSLTSRKVFIEIPKAKLDVV